MSNNQMSLSELPPEILCLIFKSLHSQDDLRKVCSVSKSFDRLATPILYRSVIFHRASSGRCDWLKFPNDEDVADQDEADNLSFGIFYRLLDDRNEVLRAFVHQITVEDFPHSSGEKLARHKLKGPQNLLAELVKKLPNLEAAYFKGSRSLPMSEGFVEVFLNHKRSPKLFLHGERGHTPISITMPFVQEIRTLVDARASAPRRPRAPDAEPFEPQRLDIHALFSAYPNIESLSVSINRLRGGCVRGLAPSTRISGLNPETTFPPLRSLSLSGYNIAQDEEVQPLWTEKFPWDKLRSLTLGRQQNPGFCKVATGKVHHLKQFEITSYGNPSSCKDLDAFLSSFHTLESLTAKGTVPSLVAIAHHSDLKHICLHVIETHDEERVSLNAKEIKALDRQHPHLKSLELDIDPHDEWPEDIVKAIATSFKDLQQLSIHVGLRLSHLINICNADRKNDGHDIRNKEAFKSILTDEKAQAFAKRIFDCRGSSNLKKVTLQTGEDLRWFSQWSPWYADAERRHAKIFEAYPPLRQGDEPYLEEPMSNYARLMESRRISLRSKFREEKYPRLSSAPRVLQASGFPSVI